MNLTSFATYQSRDPGGRFIKAKVDAAIAEAITVWANRVLTTAQEIVPVDTGELRDSGHVETSQSGSKISAAVVFDAEHAVYVEFGTGIRGAASPGAGPGPYSSTWAGMPAQPYLRPAFDEHEGEVEGLARETVAVALK